MDDEWSAALDGFAAVWERVSPPPKPVAAAERPRDPAAELRAFLTQEAQRTAYYAAAASLAELRQREQLRALAGDCRQALKKLRTEYFLMTGEQWTLPMPRLQNDGCLGFLRRSYLSEQAGEREYAAAAAGTEKAELRRVYAELAERCSARRESVRALVRGVLG